MTWTQHTPAKDGDAPEGVTLETHIIQWLSIIHDVWVDEEEESWNRGAQYRFIQRPEIIQAKLDAALARVAELEEALEVMRIKHIATAYKDSF